MRARTLFTTAVGPKHAASGTEISAKLSIERAVDDETWSLDLAKIERASAEARKDILTRFDHKQREFQHRVRVERARSTERIRQAEWELAKLEEVAARRSDP